MQDNKKIKFRSHFFFNKKTLKNFDNNILIFIKRNQVIFFCIEQT